MTTPNIAYGATAKVYCEVRDRDTLATPLFDPPVVSFAFYKPDGTSETFVYGTDSEVQRVGTGKYFCEIQADQPGSWTYEFTSSGVGGASPVGKDVGSFTVSLVPGT